MQNYYCTQGKDRIYTGTAPMLKEVNEQYGYQTAMSWLAIQIGDLNSQLGYKWQMDVRQIDDCASLILERHGGLKVTELMAFFRGMKMGDYGEFYGTVNMNAVMMGLNKFYTVRNKQLEKIYKQRDEEAKQAKERKRQSSGLMAAEEYKNFLYDCKDEFRLVGNLGGIDPADYLQLHFLRRAYMHRQLVDLSGKDGKGLQARQDAAVRQTFARRHQIITLIQGKTAGLFRSVLRTVIPFGTAGAD